jgi:hypothetical protein
VTAIFVVAEIVMFRRTPDQLTHRITNNLGDPVLVIWILRWGGHALVHDPIHLFNGNIYWPYPHTLAYADSLLPLVPVYAVLYAITGNFTASLNGLVLGLVLLNMAGTYSLTRWLTRSTAAGVIAGLAFGFSGFSLSQLGHPQLELLFPFILAVLLLFKLLERPGLGLAIGLGIVNIAVLVGALYWAALYVISVVVILVGFAIAVRGHLGKPLLRSLAVVVGITALAIPALIPYYQVQQDQTRRPLVEAYGLKPKDIISPIDRSYIYGPLAKQAIPGDEHRLFPGFVTIALAVIGLAAVLVSLISGPDRGLHRRKQARSRDPSSRDRFALLLVAVGLVAAVFALGGTVHGVKLPWLIVYEHVPGFGGLRVTARLGVAATFAAAVLAGFGFRAVSDRLPGPTARMLVAGVVAVIILAELAGPQPWATLPEDRATLAVYQALSHRAAGTVVELPMPNADADPGRWSYTEPARMVWSTIDYHPRLNGYSGYTPPTYDADADVVSTFPSPEALARLRTRRVRYVILHLGVQTNYMMYTESQAQQMIAGLPQGSRVDRFGPNYLIDLTPS